ncbi:MAG: undecaprenyl/decaprenyl-phosphate alpha-N-acetylglucosaminyl 1-phosphate transferase, partial [Chloroflexi bacterium]|nr:undecaprenyl/decaprenyl-phosphate alpha-N-acetylglucosaminyl 1-phosphate transferase [Chloroflexota bacterium]
MRLISTFGEVLPFLVAAFVIAALLALVLTPLVLRVAIRLDNVDRPDDRRINAAPIPRGGGVAVAVAFLVVAVGGIALNSQTGAVPMPWTLESADLIALLAGGAVATLLGILDDTFQLRARWQLVGQLVLAGLA